MGKYRIVEIKTKEVDWVSRTRFLEKTRYYVQKKTLIGWFDIGYYPSEELARESMSIVTTKRIIDI